MRIRLGLVRKAPSSVRRLDRHAPPLVALGRLVSLVGPPHDAPPHDANSHHHRASPRDQHPVDQRHFKTLRCRVFNTQPVFCRTGSSPRCFRRRAPAHLRITRTRCIDFGRQTVDRCRHAARQLEALHAGSDDRGLWATYIADNLPTVRADISTWTCASGPGRRDERRTAGSRCPPPWGPPRR